MRSLVSLALLVVGPVALAQVAPVPSINRNTVLDLPVFLAPGFIAIKLFQWVWTQLIKRAERTNTIRLELVQIGTLIFALVLSLLGGWLASVAMHLAWPERDLFAYLRETPVVSGAMFLSLAVHTLFALVLGALAAVVLHVLDGWFHLVPEPKKSPWAQLWEDTYDKSRHVVTVRMGGTTYFGKLKYVDTSGANRDIILEEPKQYFDETGETVQEGEVLLIRDVQQHQLLLVDLVEEERLLERERSGDEAGGPVAVGEPEGAERPADGAADPASAPGLPYSDEGGEA